MLVGAGGLALSPVSSAFPVTAMLLLMVLVPQPASMHRWIRRPLLSAWLLAGR
jgi:hypothetical protein